MCGIIGYVGSEEVVPVVLDGLNDYPLDATLGDVGEGVLNIRNVYEFDGAFLPGIDPMVLADPAFTPAANRPARAPFPPADRALVLVDSPGSRIRLDRFRQAFHGHSRAWLVSCERHELGPLAPVGTRSAAVEQLNGHMGGLVAEDLAEKLDRAVQEPLVQADQARGDVAATEGASHAGAVLDPDGPG